MRPGDQIPTRYFDTLLYFSHVWWLDECGAISYLTVVVNATT